MFKRRHKIQQNSIGRLDQSEILGTPNFLGKAATVRHAAKAAVTAGEYEKAWSLFHEEKGYLVQHCQKFDWPSDHIVTADGNVSEDLANILRLEGKHDQAFVHLLYWIMTSAKPIKRHNDKLHSYFSRCKFEGVSLKTVQEYSSHKKAPVEFSVIQSQVRQWRQQSG